MRSEKLQKLASTYTLEHCRELLEQSPTDCRRFYSMVRRDSIVAESKRVENRDAIRMALLDGPKAVSDIVKWARSRGIGDLDVSLTSVIMPQMERDAEVEWDGKLWKGVNLKPVFPPEEPIDWASTISALSNLGDGGNAVVEIPGGVESGRFMNNLRSMLNGKKDFRDFSWSVVGGCDGRVRVTKKGPKLRQEASVIPTVDRHAEIVLADIDRQVSELLALRESLRKLYFAPEEQCQ